MIALQTGDAGTAGGLVGADLLPVVAVAALAVATLVLAIAVLRGPGHRRAYGAVGVAFPGALALAYGAVVADLPEHLGAGAASALPVARFTAYAFAFLLAAWLLSRLGGAGRELTLVLAVATLGHVGGVAGWLLLAGPAALAAVGTSAALGLVVLYLLVGTVGGEVHDDRSLCYAKLRSLLVLVWGLVLATLVLSPRGLDVLDGYTAVLVGAYLDVVLAGGLGAVVVGSGDALDRLAGVPGSARRTDVASPTTGAGGSGFGPDADADATAVGDGGGETEAGRRESVGQQEEARPRADSSPADEPAAEPDEGGPR